MSTVSRERSWMPVRLNSFALYFWHKGLWVAGSVGGGGEFMSWRAKRGLESMAMEATLSVLCLYEVSKYLASETSRMTCQMVTFIVRGCEDSPSMPPRLLTNASRPSMWTFIPPILPDNT